MTNLDNIFQEMEAKTQKNEGSDFYKVVEGSNKLRILTDFQKVETIFKNNRFVAFNFEGRKLEQDEVVRTQAWAWAINRQNNELVIVQFGKTILGQIVAYRNSSDYGFSTFPMPYDIDLRAKGAGTKEVEYTIVPARANTEVSQSEMEMLNKKKTISDIVKAIIAKQNEKNVGYEYPENNLGEPKF